MHDRALQTTMTKVIFTIYTRTANLTLTALIKSWSSWPFRLQLRWVWMLVKSEKSLDKPLQRSPTPTKSDSVEYMKTNYVLVKSLEKIAGTNLSTPTRSAWTIHFSMHWILLLKYRTRTRIKGQSRLLLHLLRLLIHQNLLWTLKERLQSLPLTGTQLRGSITSLKVRK